MAKKITIEELASMTQRDFTDLEQRLTNRMDKGFGELATKIAQLTEVVRDGFQHVNSRLDLVREDTSDLPAMREELRDLRPVLTGWSKRWGWQGNQPSWKTKTNTSKTSPDLTHLVPCAAQPTLRRVWEGYKQRKGVRGLP